MNNLKKVLLISLPLIFGAGLLLNDCGWSECDALCRAYCKKFYECFYSITDSDTGQCEQLCRDGVEEHFTDNACNHGKIFANKSDCKEFKRSASGCSDECSSLGKTVCSGNGFKVCVSNDSNGCNEYTPVTSCGDLALCREGMCIQTSSTILTLRINSLCGSLVSIKYRYFGLYSGSVWPSPKGYYYTNSQSSDDIMCLVGDLICYGAASGNDLFWGVGLDNTNGCLGCCSECVENAVYGAWDLTCD